MPPPVLALDACDGTITFEATDGHGVLRLRGETSVNFAADFHRVLRTAIESGDEVEVDLTEVVELDFSAIQLLWAARKSAERAGHRFVLRGALPGAVAEQFRLTGLNPFCSCTDAGEAKLG